MATRYRFVVYAAGDTYTAKPRAEGVLTRKHDAIRRARTETTNAGLGAHGAVYGGERLSALLYQVRNTYGNDGAAGRLVVDPV